MTWISRVMGWVLIGLPGLGVAEVVRLEVTDRQVFAEGRTFGVAGPYERVSGKLWLEVDPLAGANARVNDLKLAPRNERGKVVCWTDFFLLKPVEASKGNGRLLYDVNNRGNKLALWTFNGGERSNDPSTEAHVGNGFLMRHGWSVLWTGWNGEVQADDSNRLLIGLPVATEAGKVITGRAHLEISTTEQVFSRAFSWSPWGISAAFPAVDLDHHKATLTMRAERGGTGIEIPHSEWAFGRWENGVLVADPTHVYVKEGFRPGWLYDLVYEAKEPRVTGLGLAALRDAVAFFRREAADGEGVANPLAGAIQQAVIYGISQSGRLAHHFIYEGFNADERGRMVFDGALIHVAGAGKGMFNQRFRMTTEYGTQHEGNWSGSEFFPLSPATQTDPVTGQTGDTLARARAAGVVPKMIFTQSSTEYWSRAASLLHTDVTGTKDGVLPEEVRVYLVAGSQHLGGGEPTPGICQQPRNPLDDRGPVQRAMLVALEKWLAEGVEPPPSRYPRLDEQTLVPLEAVVAAFPKLPWLNLPSRSYQPLRLDFGPRFLTEGIADEIPPQVGAPFRALLPTVDVDGNEVAGIRLPEIEVPLGTHTGWNLRAAAVGAESMLAPLDGMFLPFARTRAERERTGDPRLSLEERYGNREHYLARLTEAALKLHKEGFLLEEDVVRIVERGAAQKAW
jgi:hypothetical protein